MMRKLAFTVVCLAALWAMACNNGDDACKMAKNSLAAKCTDEAGKTIATVDPGQCNPDSSEQRCTARCVALVATCDDLSKLAASMQDTRAWLAQKNCASPAVDAGAACPPPPTGGAGGASSTGGTGGTATGGSPSTGGTAGAGGAKGGAGGVGTAGHGGAAAGGAAAGGRGGSGGAVSATGGSGSPDASTSTGGSSQKDASVQDAGKPGVCPVTTDTSGSIGPLYSEVDLAISALGGPAIPSDAGTPDAGNFCSACSDNKLNGDESDLDCGGSCAPCADKKKCRVNVDCQSGVCQNGKCAPHPPAAGVSSQFRLCLKNCLLN